MRTADGHVHSIQYLLQTTSTLPPKSATRRASRFAAPLRALQYQYYCSSVHRRVADWSEAG